MPTPKVLVVSPAAIHAIKKPANAGAKIRAKFMLVVVSAIAVKIKRSSTRSGTKAFRAGNDSANTIPLNSPNAMKSQKPTFPDRMNKAMMSVAMAFKD